MEKRLECLRGQIELKMKRCTGLIAILTILLVVVSTGRIPLHLADQNGTDFLQGFQVGIMVALDILAVMNLTRYRNALKDETKLKRLYAQEHDERQKYIGQMAGKSSMVTNLVLLSVAAVIAGYFSFQVFITLLVVMLIQCLVTLGMKCYYSNKVTGEEE